MAISEANPPDLSKPVMPTLQRAFSKNSRVYQRITKVVVFLGLFLVGISALVSAFHGKNIQWQVLAYHVNAATAIATLFFLVAAGIRFYRIYSTPERTWFSSRALAERTRSLSWRYAVRGAPFEKPQTGPDDSDESFEEALDQATYEANASRVRYMPTFKRREISVITEWMHDTRAQDLPARQALYAEKRIRNQEDFYEKRARQNIRNAQISQWVLLIIEIGGAAVAAINALAFLDLDLVGVVGIIAAGVTAWSQFRQYSELASAYGAMAYRMASFRERCLRPSEPWNEDTWARFVGLVEDSLREENGAWRRIVQQGANETH